MLPAHIPNSRAEPDEGPNGLGEYWCKCSVCFKKNDGHSKLVSRSTFYAHNPHWKATQRQRAAVIRGPENSGPRPLKRPRQTTFEHPENENSNTRPVPRSIATIPGTRTPHRTVAPPSPLHEAEGGSNDLDHDFVGLNVAVFEWCSYFFFLPRTTLMRLLRLLRTIRMVALNRGARLMILVNKRTKLEAFRRTTISPMN